MNLNIKKYVKIGTAVLVVALLGYFIQINQPYNATKNSSKLQVVTSFYPLYFFASQIVLDKADVYNITPSGAEPHDYEPSAYDLAKIEDSSILILNGSKLETWGNNIKENLKNTKKIITVGETIANQEIEDGGEKIQDPHVWLSPMLAKKEVILITQGLSQADPVNKDFYQANADKLLIKLDNLDTKFRQELSNCAKKDIITSHAAFGYLASEYGLKQIPISGLSPDTEPSAKNLTEIADFVKKNQIKYIFFESLISPKLSQTIASETGATTLELNPIEGLSNEEIKNGKSYISVMENNLTNLKIALECQ